MSSLISVVSLVMAQAAPNPQPAVPFSAEVQAFVKADKENPPEPGQILFIGSSSFVGWRSISKDFPDYKILNRAFGGSSLPHLLLHAEIVIKPYKPKQILIYCGENDFASDPKLSASGLLKRFIALHDKIRSWYPKVPIAYVSIKPSPSRWSARAKSTSANTWIREFCESHPNLTFINVWDPMLDAEGRPRPEIFGNDMLHMNAQGYAIWKRIIGPFLKK